MLERPKLVGSVTEAVGHTALVKVRFASLDCGATILAKMENTNPLGSVKDRIAVSMIDAAERQGKLVTGGCIIEPTSGNTGIGLAFVAASRGYRLILTMPESMSKERRQVLTALGADLVLTPAERGMTGAVEKARELTASTPGAFMPMQFENPANPDAHRHTTALEIWDATSGNVDAFVAGVGTGGTITGVGEVLKSRNPNIKVFAVEPQESPVLSGGKPGPHGIQGIGAGFVPKVLNRAVIDGIEQVNYGQASSMAREIALREGILVGVSAGANLYAAIQVARRPEFQGKTIVTVFCDSGERYLSTGLHGQSI